MDDFVRKHPSFLLNKTVTCTEMINFSSNHAILDAIQVHACSLLLHKYCNCMITSSKPSIKLLDEKNY